MHLLDMADESSGFAGMEEYDDGNSLNWEELHCLDITAEDAACDRTWGKFDKLM